MGCLNIWLFPLQQRRNSWHLQGPSEPVPTFTLSCGFVAGASGGTLARLQAAPPEGTGRARLLAVASDEARRTLTRPLHGVARGPVVAPARLGAARAPVSVIAVWKVRARVSLVPVSGHTFEL